MIPVIGHGTPGAHLFTPQHVTVLAHCGQAYVLAAWRFVTGSRYEVRCNQLAEEWEADAARSYVPVSAVEFDTLELDEDPTLGDAPSFLTRYWDVNPYIDLEEGNRTWDVLQSL